PIRVRHDVPDVRLVHRLAVHVQHPVPHLYGVARDPHDPLQQVELRLVGTLEDDDLPPVDVFIARYAQSDERHARAVGRLADDQEIPDQRGVLHRAGRDRVRLDEKCTDHDEDHCRDRDGLHPLPRPLCKRWPCRALFRPLRRRPRRTASLDLCHRVVVLLRPRSWATPLHGAARAVRYSEANTPQGPDQSHGTHRRPAGPGPGPGNALRPDAARLEGSASSREVLIRIHYGRAGFDPPEPPYGPGPEPRRCRGEGTTPRHATTPRRRPGLSPPSVAIAGFGRPPPTTAAGPVSDIPPRYRTHRTGKDRRPTGRPVHART